MAERPKAAVLKTVGHASAPWVRILLPPPYFPYKIKYLTSRLVGAVVGPSTSLMGVTVADLFSKADRRIVTFPV
jgi:hypothetical protein